jgi:hypothetical protein
VVGCCGQRPNISLSSNRRWQKNTKNLLINLQTLLISKRF